MRSSTILEQLSLDRRYAFRTLARSPGFSAFAVLSLALGIGANTAIFTFINAAFLKPLPYPDSVRILALEQRELKTNATTRVHPRSFVGWQEHAGSFEALAIAQPVPLDTEGADGYEQIPRLFVSQDLFRVFGVGPLLGPGFSQNGAGSLDPRQGDVAEVVLSHGYWQRRFGSDPSIIGKTFAAGRGMAVVTGVMPAGFQVGNLNVDVYSPMRIDRARPEAIGSRSFLCYGRLRPNVTLQAAQAELSALAVHIGREEISESGFGVRITGLRQYLVGENRTALLLLFGIVLLVLLISCANLAGLILTRGLGRRRANLQSAPHSERAVGASFSR